MSERKVPVDLRYSVYIHLANRVNDEDDVETINELLRRDYHINR